MTDKMGVAILGLGACQAGALRDELSSFPRKLEGVNESLCSAACLFERKWEDSHKPMIRRSMI